MKRYLEVLLWEVLGFYNPRNVFVQLATRIIRQEKIILIRNDIENILLRDRTSTDDIVLDDERSLHLQSVLLVIQNVL